ncbi:MAG: RNA-binding protein [Halanaerobiaceae bacterium]|jgi:ribosomal protein L14E/L6E/L27E|nr:RNA-binding protein [Halanaerobiaceae bacterium]
MLSPCRLGEIVISRAGRDSGKHYIVVNIESENYVMVADGEAKRIEHPKRKNVKHLIFTGDINDELAIWLENKKRIRNEDLKKILKDYVKNEEAKKLYG